MTLLGRKKKDFHLILNDEILNYSRLMEAVKNIMAKTPALIGIIKRAEIWDNVHNECWYHIPVENAPRNIKKCQYLGFYFPQFFPEEVRYHVSYYSEIKNIAVFKRIELFPDEVSHKKSDKDYYKLSLGEITELPKPIPSRRWRRIVFIPTSLERLYQADEINDLYDTSPLEEVIYKKLKESEFQAERQLYVYTEKHNYCLDFGIYCREGNIDVECDGETYHNLPDAYTKDRKRNNELTSHGWRVLRFDSKQIRNDPNGCMKTIAKTVKLLGGIK